MWDLGKVRIGSRRGYDWIREMSGPGRCGVGGGGREQSPGGDNGASAESGPGRAELAASLRLVLTASG